jgi:hypothetical protein
MSYRGGEAHAWESKLLVFMRQEEEVLMETIIDHSTIEEWRAGLRGAAFVPGEEGYD